MKEHTDGIGLVGWCVIVGWAVTGGVVVYLHEVDEQKRQFQSLNFFSRIIISGFTGTIMAVTAFALGVHNLWLLIPIAAFTGSEGMPMLLAIKKIVITKGLKRFERELDVKTSRNTKGDSHE